MDKQHLYVCELPVMTRLNIFNAVYASLYAEGYRGEELQKAVENAGNSRVCDLKDTIDLESLGL